ncbi:alpha/beta hydrolase family protein [Qipengyuania spongiae]|uniref:Alpha/beta hydrolase n=1 Tax=Qipengyuania spongiae TaxID=2909673 RepID=A0ABY5T2L8_9SPHN|nr:alpha/beta hydrolase [Qipengyuania spongiae]UVI39573.1 alpha/beta hydrolase [Qipengyuania spongiae]
MKHALFTATAALLALSVPAAGFAQEPIIAYKQAGAAASTPVETIAYGADAEQVADLRLPDGAGPFPVAILVHGGCWMASVDGRKNFSSVADALGKRGFATWNIEYRRIGNEGGGWPGTFEDVAAAVDKLAEVAARYDLDLGRVTIVGHSAGAHLALWAASRSRLPEPWSATKIAPVSVVAIDGPGALVPFIGIDAQVCGGQPVIVPLMGGTPAERPAEYAIASPIDHLPLGIRQLSVGGSLGDLMQPYIDAARASGDTVAVLDPPDANHFDIVTPGTPNGDAVIDFIARFALQSSD